MTLLETGLIVLLTASVSFLLTQRSTIKRLSRRPAVILASSPGRDLAEDFAIWMKKYSQALSENGIDIPFGQPFFEEDEIEADDKARGSTVNTGQYL